MPQTVTLRCLLKKSSELPKDTLASKMQTKKSLGDMVHCCSCDGVSLKMNTKFSIADRMRLNVQYFRPPSKCRSVPLSSLVHPTTIQFYIVKKTSSYEQYTV
jgi:hypothetical protein